ncbi:type I toxin-antitoxin system Ibs family toxin [Escherichia coli]|nr:type I toxin-antitoxin system Ibs family toxin [Escherichia coli]QTF42927.1 type I toxin-antitoxin system Ibs family toxin [Escherichia coli O176:H45]
MRKHVIILVILLEISFQAY